jgi:3-hydroxyisobutyrate dehydrogenase/2-hydroxy-3-oxopropionate reductase
MKLGFLGLGIMGYPMARHLLEAGHQVALWSNTSAKVAKLAASHAGARVCTSPSEVGANAEIVFLCVGDTAMSEQVTFGPDGLVHGLADGAIVADCSTVAPSYARSAAERLAAKGVSFVDAPCTGSKAGAEGGVLTFMVGADPAIYEKVKPALEAMGKLLYYCGGIGMGLHAKLSQNLILCNLLQGFNEGMVLAAKAGVDADLMLDILNNSAAKSGLISVKGPNVLKRDFSTNFSVRWMHKDIGLMLDSATELGVPMPLTAVTRQMFQAAMAEGHAEEDISSTIKVLERMVGVEVKSGQ